MIKIKITNANILFATVAIFLVAVFQPFGLSLDYLHYDYFFKYARFNFSDEINNNRFEPGFMYVASALVKIFESNFVVYGVLVAIAVAVKLVYLKRFSDTKNFFYLAGALYIFKFLPLLELTQLRASLALSILLMAFFYIKNSRKILGTGVGLLAGLFHYSSLMLLPFLLLPKLSRKNSIILALLVFVILYMTSHYGVGLAGKYLQVFQEYDSGGYGDVVLSRFSPVYFPEFFILAFAIFYWNDLTEGMRQIVTIELIGFSILNALIDFPVVAVRGREFFSVMWILFVAQSAVCVDRIKFAVYIFVSTSIGLGVYLYFILDFFGRQTG